eukprot:TRINITY_DN25483_c0_g1_i1.p1 TRINITY_DN25483_c0_g1~~TRINITY_DN25483_c0_g1_i1.p1  ORF type:complete len:574 (+),score=147.28 TRINITY_DN25483_c0_g1_i1:100-1821(+)
MSPSPAEKALDKLAQAAGSKVNEPLQLLMKLFSNIKDHPKELKYRRLNAKNPKLEKELFSLPGAGAFIKAAGFVMGADDHLELPASAGVQFNDALIALQRKFAAVNEASQMSAINVSSGGGYTESYAQAVQGGAQGRGRAEIAALAGRPDGQEALKVVSRILGNVQLYPTTESYKSVSMSKAGQKLAPALPIMQMIGWEVVGDNLVLRRMDMDVITRFVAMIHWATNPAAAQLTLPPPTGALGFALGALLGVAVGDALGAPLEMMEERPLGPADIDKAFEMCGGGHWSLAPGQVTEDTELTICLAEALTTATGQEFPSYEVTRQYGEWAASRPFDMGSTTNKAAFSRGASASDMERRALGFEANCSNGALIRCMPLAVWGVGRAMSPEDLGQAVRADARLSHPNFTCGVAGATYAIAAQHLIRSGGDVAGAQQAVSTWIDVHKKRKGGEMLEELEKWLQEAHSPSDLSDAFGPEIGSAKWGYVHAFRHLSAGSSFEVAMRATLAGGGDTDSNAAIVGGLIGAARGVQGIPERWLRAVLASDPNSGGGSGQARPAEYHPSKLVRLAEQLLTPAK